MASKLSPPAPRGDAVERASLARLAERFPRCPLVLVRAPAGYGKTSLLAQWWTEEKACGAASAWLTLDAGDDDPARLLTHLAATLARGRAVADLAELQAELQANPDFARLVDWLELPAPPFTLFLDDFESVRHPDSIAIVRRLAARFEEPARLVIASRSRVSLEVGKKRVLGRVREIDVGELRFSTDEARALLAARGVALDAKTLVSLIVRTEGWPAAIELAALALANRADPARFVESFSGSFRGIAEFLAEEVLERQPPDLRDFLVDTCILGRLSAELCDAIRGAADAAKQIERLEQAGVPLRALDEAGEWHCYHRVFAEFLQKVQRRERGSRVAELHRAAARWHSDDGNPIDAVDHALAAGDSMLAATLVEPYAKESVRQGQLATVLRWAEALSPAALDAHLAIRSASAWTRIFLRDFRGARRELDTFRARVGDDRVPTEVEDDFNALEPTLLTFEDRIPEALDDARSSLSQLRGVDPFDRGVLLNVLAYGLAMRGEFTEARSRLVESRANHGRAGSVFGTVYSITFAGVVEAVAGNLGAARLHYEEAKALAGRRPGVPSAVGSVVTGFFAELLYEIGDLEAAETRLRTSLPLVREIALVDMVIAATLTMAGIHAARGHFEDAERLLYEGDLDALERGGARMSRAYRGSERRPCPWRAEGGASSPGPDRRRGHDGAGRLVSARPRKRGLRRRRSAAGGSDRRGPSCFAGAAPRAEARSGRRPRIAALRLAVLEAIALDALGERAAALQALRPALSRGAAAASCEVWSTKGRGSSLYSSRSATPAEIPSGSRDRLFDRLPG